MPDLHTLIDGLRSAYDVWGYPIVFLGAMFENTVLLGLVLPGGTLVMLGAAYAHDGSMSLPVVLLLAVLGMVMGTSLDYALGRFGLHRALERTRFAPALHVRLATAERFLERRGVWAFLLAHFIGHVRSFLAITAGMTRLPVRRFLLFEGIAALTWNVMFVGVGYALGENWDRLQHIMGQAGAAVILTALAIFGIHRIIRRIRRSRRRAAPEILRTHAVPDR
jgi:membrane protein DedA with SNARE-associated domain